jgi:hypothetical protein
MGQKNNGIFSPNFVTDNLDLFLRTSLFSAEREHAIPVELAQG